MIELLARVLSAPWMKDLALTAKPARKRTLVVMGLIIFGVSGCGRNCADSREPTPNFILITIDTVRQDHLSLYGYDRDTSPGLAALAKDSITFTRAYTPLPSTWPAHFALMSSRPPAVLGVLANGQAPGDQTFPVLAQHLRDQGYATAAITGSDVFKSPGGIERGFESFDNKIGKRRRGRAQPFPYARGADEVVRRAEKWIGQREPRKPFFLWMHFWDAHGPYYAPPEYLSRYQTDDRLQATMRERNQAERFSYVGKNMATAEAINQYDGAICFLDDQLAGFWEFLKQHGLYQPGLIIVAADHGEGLMEHGIYIHGPVIYQTSVHVPLIIHWPGRAGAGKTLDALVNIMDLAPTALAILGVPPLPGSFGHSLRPCMEQNRCEDRFFSLESVAKPDRGEQAPQRMFGVVDRQFKYIRLESGTELLFDLSSDPDELRNVAAEKPELLAARRKRLDDFRKQYAGLAKPGAQISPEMEKALKSLGY